MEQSKEKTIENKDVTVSESKPITDFSEKEIETLEAFKRKGSPGLIKATETIVYQAFSLYMGGKTYDEISNTLKLKKELVLYLSNRFGWPTKKFEYLENISKNLAHKITRARLENINTLTNLSQFFHVFFEKKVSEYLISGKENDFFNLPLKHLEKYLKLIEVLDRQLPDSNNKEKKELPEIHIHGATRVVQESDDTININTNNDDGTTSFVRVMAKYKKEKEKERESAKN